MKSKGGKRVGAGRPPGIISKVKQMLKNEITEKDVQLALKTLRNNMKGKLATASNAAAMYLLDQKFGKARQPIANSDDEPFKVEVVVRSVS